MNTSDYMIIVGIGFLVAAYAMKKPKQIESKPKMEKINDSIDG